MALAIGFSAAPARADPLDEAACTALGSEREKLVAEGLKADMAKGPDWAKANLGPERMKGIEHLIEVEEQLSFRCPRSPLFMPARASLAAREKSNAAKAEAAVKAEVEKTGTEKAGTGQTGAEKASKGEKAAKGSAKGEEQAKSVETTPAAAPAPPTGDVATPAPPSIHAKKKKKAKPSDAYVPPPSSFGVNASGE